MLVTDFVDPLEYPDWRWSRVRSLVTEGKQPTPRDDKYIHRAHRFACDLENCDGSDTARYDLTLKHRDIARAIGLHNNGANRKCFIEALCLCSDVHEDGIAKYMGETEVMVRYYHKLFFDVRGKLDNVGFICSRVMEPDVMKRLDDYKDPNIAWKMAALFGGYEAVKACWEFSGMTESVRKYYHGMGTAAMFKDFGIGTRLRPLTKWSTESVAEHILKFAELEIKNRVASGSRQSEEQVNALRDIMGSIKFFISDPNKTESAREPRLFEKLDKQLVAELSAAAGD